MTMTFDRKVPLSEQRMRVSLAKGVRKKGKNHGTGKRNHAIRQQKKNAAKAKRERFMRALRVYKAASAAYWRGDADTHPRLTKATQVTDEEGSLGRLVIGLR